MRKIVGAVTHCSGYLPVTLYSLVKSTTPTSNSFPISNYSLGLLPRRQYDAPRAAGTSHDSRASARPLRGRQRSCAAPPARERNTITSLNSRLVRAACAADTVCPYRLCARAARGRRRFQSYKGTVRQV